MAGIQSQIDRGAVVSHVSNVCPQGTKFYVLECGWLEVDEGYVVRGGNTSKLSTSKDSFVNKRREMPVYCILIDHPHEGLILWETGCGKDYPEVWGSVISDVFSRVRYEPQHELRAAIAATGHRIEDVKKIILGHLHVDHAGGLDEFFDRPDVEIWVHDLELRAAFWSVATGADIGVYLGHYLKLGLNWKTFDDRSLDFCQGITLHHMPGHTDGLVIMQINMPDSGTFFFLSDHCHVIENVCMLYPDLYGSSDGFSGVTAFLKAGLREIIQHGFEAPRSSNRWSEQRRDKSSQATTKNRSWP